MRNFILLIRKYKFLITFLLLQFFCFYLIIQNNSYQRSAYISTSNSVVGKIYTAYGNMTDYLKLGATNRSLAEENARLRKADSVNFYDKSFHHIKINDSIHLQQYEYISARVINNSVSKVNNYITIDKGSIHGVKPYMAVISGSGIVGIVKDVSEHFATVTSMLHSDTRISARLKKNNYFGTAVWNGISPRYGSLKDIPSHAKVSAGDTVETSTFSGLFPRGIMIGKIIEVSNSGESFKNVKLQFATDFHNLSYVYIVRNLLKEERDSLEIKTQSDVE